MACRAPSPRAAARGIRWRRPSADGGIVEERPERGPRHRRPPSSPSARRRRRHWPPRRGRRRRRPTPDRRAHRAACRDAAVGGRQAACRPGGWPRPPTVATASRSASKPSSGAPGTSMKMRRLDLDRDDVERWRRASTVRISEAMPTRSENATSAASRPSQTIRYGVRKCLATAVISGQHRLCQSAPPTVNERFTAGSSARHAWRK